MSKLTPRQRDVLHKRIALALCWYAVPGAYRDDANRSANRVLDAIEDASTSAMALRRGVDAVVRSVENEEKAS